MLRISRWFLDRVVGITTCTMFLIISLAATAASRPLVSGGRSASLGVKVSLPHPTGLSAGAGPANVLPSYGTMTAPSNTTGNYASFEVDNTDWNAESYSLYCWVNGSVTSCNAPYSVYVDGYGAALKRIATQEAPSRCQTTV